MEKHSLAHTLVRMRESSRHRETCYFVGHGVRYDCHSKLCHTKELIDMATTKRTKVNLEFLLIKAGLKDEER